MIWRARTLSLLVGFLSLSQEILWLRLASFIYLGLPQTFGGVLGLYLCGIAIGAGIGARACKSGRNLLNVAGAVLLVAGLLDLAFPWTVARAFQAGTWLGAAALAACVVVTSMLKSIVFPIAHQLGSSNNERTVGSTVSKVYFANIVGSTLGPLVTGFVLLNVLSLQQCLMLMAAATVVIGAWCLWQSDSIFARWLVVAIAVSAVAAAFIAPNFLIDDLVMAATNSRDELFSPAHCGAGTGGEVEHVVENRYGIIHLLRPKVGDECVFGGNAYDGRINIDFMRDSNQISRLYMLAALKPRPIRILVIGMSAGSWTRVLSAFPSLEHMDVVEINPGYAKITASFASLKPILADPRIAIHYDDGRRWLKRHPSEKYDMVVMNTTFHWRAYVSLLMSRDFLAVIKSHLTDDGLLAYNATGSPDAIKTAAAVFKSVYRYMSFVVAGDAIVMPDEDAGIRRVADLRLDGQPLVDMTDARVVARLRIAFRRFEPYSQIEDAELRSAQIITDQNMITEFRHNPVMSTLIRSIL